MARSLVLNLHFYYKKEKSLPWVFIEIESWPINIQIKYTKGLQSQLSSSIPVSLFFLTSIKKEKKGGSQIFCSFHNIFFKLTSTFERCNYCLLIQCKDFASIKKKDHTFMHMSGIPCKVIFQPTKCALMLVTESPATN